MTPFLDDDPELVNFLRRYHPQVPAATPELEDQVLAAVQATSLKPSPRLRSSQLLQNRFWVVSSAIAAGLIAGVVSYRALTPARPNATELANLESFIESSWYGTVSDTPENELFPTADSAVN